MNIADMHVEEIMSIIDASLVRIETKFQDSKGLILTESDLKCLLYLDIHETFHEPIDTVEPGIKSTPLHTEVSWFNREGKLRITPDITILDPRNLRIKSKFPEAHVWPNKQFAFQGNAVVIELKFVREKNGICSEKELEIREDIEKVIELIERHQPTVHGYVVVFNKTNRGFKRVDRLKGEYSGNDKLRIFYASSHVTFETMGDAENNELKSR